MYANIIEKYVNNSIKSKKTAAESSFSHYMAQKNFERQFTHIDINNVLRIKETTKMSKGRKPAYSNETIAFHRALTKADLDSMSDEQRQEHSKILKAAWARDNFKKKREARKQHTVEPFEIIINTGSTIVDKSIKAAQDQFNEFSKQIDDPINSTELFGLFDYHKNKLITFNSKERMEGWFDCLENSDKLQGKTTNVVKCKISLERLEEVDG